MHSTIIEREAFEVSNSLSVVKNPEAERKRDPIQFNRDKDPIQFNRDKVISKGAVIMQSCK